MLKSWRWWVSFVVGFAGLGPWAMAGGAAQEPVQRIVVFRETVSPAARIQIVQNYKGTVVHDLHLIHAVAAQFSPAQVRTAEAGLKSRPEVVRIDEDFRQKWIESRAPSFSDVEIPSVESVIRPLRLHRRMSEADKEVPWGVDKVNAPKAWAKTQGSGVKVAVIDTGIDYDHPDLKANIKGGWNATSKDKPADFKDDNGHGTHVSGTIAAVKDGNGVVGVAPKAELYGVKVLDAGGSGTFADVIAGIQWAADNKMDVVNMSLGASRGNASLEAAIKAAAKAGVAQIAAAGNSSGAVGYPAAYPEVIAVSASDSKDKLAYFSSRGPQIAFIAPGVAIPSTYMGGKYEDLSGTSMACPHMVGLAALAISAKSVHGIEAVRAVLKAAAAPLPGLTPEQQGAGLVNAEKLVQ